MAFWDFLKDANTEKKTAGKVFRFLSGAVPGVSEQRAVKKKAQDIKEKISLLPQSAQRDRDLESVQKAIDVPDVAESARDFAVSAARGLVRIPETAARSFV